MNASEKYEFFAITKGFDGVAVALGMQMIGY